MKAPLTIEIFPGDYAVCRLDAAAQIPPQILEEPFFALMRTRDELSFIIAEERVAPDWQAEKGWRILKVLGPLDFGMIGVLSSIASLLADAGVSIFVCSTYDTDYVMVKKDLLDKAVDSLQANHFEILQSG